MLTFGRGSRHADPWLFPRARHSILDLQYEAQIRDLLGQRAAQADSRDKPPNLESSNNVSYMYYMYPSRRRSLRGERDRLRT